MNRSPGSRAVRQDVRAGRVDGGRDGDVRLDAAWLALGGLLAAIVMLFVGFTSAYLVRSTEGDWLRSPLPSALWFSTTVLLASSAALEVARAAGRRGDWSRARWALDAGMGLGLLFVIGQLVAWRQLAAAGVFLATNPHSSFFYLLTLMHGLHVLGGLVALAYARFRLAGLRPRPRLTAVGSSRRPPAAASRPSAAVPQAGTLARCATYWHFVDGLWLYLFAMLYLI